MERNNSFTLKGKLFKKGDVQQITDNFKKREFVMEVSNQVGDKVYTELPQFELLQDKVQLLEYVSVGDQIEVDFSVSGREWTPKDSDEKRYFTTLKAWFIKSLETRKVNTDTESTAAPSEVHDIEEDNLPF